MEILDLINIEKDKLSKIRLNTKKKNMDGQENGLIHLINQEQ
jgi:hypothetical protein